MAVNKIEELRNRQECKDARLLEITNYIYANYKHVTLDELSEKFFLSKPYLSKYIKEKSGMTFGDILKNVRMKKACTMLEKAMRPWRALRMDSGIPENVEHFSTGFLRRAGCTRLRTEYNWRGVQGGKRSMKSKSKSLCCYFHSAYVSVRVGQVPKRGLDLSLLDSPTSNADNSVIFKTDD